MSRPTYSYLDLTVLDGVREHLVSSSAAILFADGLSDIVWCNAEGVALIGADSVRQAIEGDVQVNSALSRQMANALTKLGNGDEPVGAVMRMRQGFKSGLVGFTLRPFALPDGGRGVLLLSEPLRGRRDREDAQAQRMVDTLDGRGHSSAILLKDGRPLAVSPSFEALAIENSVLASLCAQTADETDRLVKRAIATAKGALPGGMARLSDGPGRYLLIMAGMEETDAEGADDTLLLDTPDAAGGSSEPQEALNPAPAPARVGAFSNRKSGSTLSRWYYKAPAPVSAPAAGEPEDRGTQAEEEPVPDSVVDAPAPSIEAAPEPGNARQEQETPSPSVTAAIIAGAVATGAAVVAAASVVRTKSIRSGAVEPSPMSWSDGGASDDAVPASDGPIGRSDDVQATDILSERGGSGDEPDYATEVALQTVIDEEVAEPETAAPRPLADIELVEPVEPVSPAFEFLTSRKAVRFAWETDADNMIVSVGREMTPALGTDAAKMVGQTWTQAANALDLDGGADVDALLDRRDTWSGRTVLWSAADGSAIVPVDLAGLPSYDRERNFKGFNGFGIIRMADARAVPMGVAEQQPADAPVLETPETAPENVRTLSRQDREVFDEIGNRLTDKRALDTVEQSTGAPAGLAGEAIAATGANRAADDESVDDPRQDAEAVNDAPDSSEAGGHDRESIDEVLSTAPGAVSAAAVIAPVVSTPEEGEDTGEPADDSAVSKVVAAVTYVPSAFVKPAGPDLPDVEGAPTTFDDTGPINQEGVEEPEPEDAIVIDPVAALPDSPAGVASGALATQGDIPVPSDDPPLPEPDEDKPRPEVPDHAVDTSILARLPIPLLVYRDHELLFANADFYNLTGYASLPDFAEAGGVERLFGANDDLQRNGPGAPIYHRNGELLDVRAHLQHVPWDTARAMLLTLRPGSGPDGRRRQPEPDLPNDAGNIVSFTQSRSGKETDRSGVVNGGTGFGGAGFGGVGVDDLRAVLDTASDGVIMLTPQGQIRAASRSAEALLDRPSADMAGRNLAEFLAPESRDKLADYLVGISGGGVERLLNDGREFMLHTPGGGLIPVFMTIGRLTELRHAVCSHARCNGMAPHGGGVAESQVRSGAGQ